MTSPGIFRNLPVMVRHFFLSPLFLTFSLIQSVFIFPDMSFFKGLVESLGSILSTTYSTSSSHESHPNPSSPNSHTMEGIAGPSVSNERVAYKLKSYFDLAKEEIAKAVRAEEWGLVEDAVLHYNNAQRILVEASSTSTPSFISERYRKFYLFLELYSFFMITFDNFG